MKSEAFLDFGVWGNEEVKEGWQKEEGECREKGKIAGWTHRGSRSIGRVRREDEGDVFL